MTEPRGRGDRRADLTTRFDSPADSPSDVLVRAVAIAENVEPKTLDPLPSTVDPDALDTVLDTDRSKTTVRFSYEGYRVVVSADGSIELFADD